MDVLQIAYIAHHANAIYCSTIGDHSQPLLLSDAPDSQRQETIARVEAIRDGKVTSPDGFYESQADRAKAELFFGMASGLLVHFKLMAPPIPPMSPCGEGCGCGDGDASAELANAVSPLPSAADLDVFCAEQERELKAVADSMAIDAVGTQTVADVTFSDDQATIEIHEVPQSEIQTEGGN